MGRCYPTVCKEEGNSKPAPHAPSPHCIGKRSSQRQRRAGISDGIRRWPGVVSEYIAGREFVLIAALHLDATG